MIIEIVTLFRHISVRNVMKSHFQAWSEPIRFIICDWFLGKTGSSQVEDTGENQHALTRERLKHIRENNDNWIKNWCQKSKFFIEK